MSLFDLSTIPLPPPSNQRRIALHSGQQDDPFDNFDIINLLGNHNERTTVSPHFRRLVDAKALDLIDSFVHAKYPGEAYTGIVPS